MISRGAAAFLQPISVILFARSLGTDEQGVFAILLTISMTGGQICLLGLDVSLIYVASNGKRVGRVAFQKALFAMGLAFSISVICFSVFPSLLGFFVPMDSGRIERTALLLFSLGIHSFLGLLTGYNIGLGRISLVMEGSLAQQVVFFVLALATSLTAIPANANAALTMYTVSLLPNLFFLMRNIKGHSGPAEPGEMREPTLRDQFKLAMPHYISVLASSVAFRADIFFLGATMAPSILGAYSVAKTGAEAINLIPRAISPLLTVYVAKGMKEEELAPLYKLLIALSALGVMGCWVLAKPVVHLVLGQDYQNAVPFVKILILGSAMAGIWGLFAHHLYGLGNSLIRLESVALSNIVALPAMFFAASSAMPQGVALACVMGSTVAAVYISIRLKNRLERGLSALVFPQWGDVVRLWNWCAKPRPVR